MVTKTQNLKIGSLNIPIGFDIQALEYIEDDLDTSYLGITARVKFLPSVLYRGAECGSRIEGKELTVTKDELVELAIQDQLATVALWTMWFQRVTIKNDVYDEIVDEEDEVPLPNKKK